ncbi:TetR/AcrR family transcriptional regulator [Vibrio fortis]|uniref:TetR/AcrR family transcriptional regulator n=1 Tax=Vibrio fortis TaxID=212667 RepID=A0A5N3SAI0_9VIBR|nr:TetR/AcrR family transcriptional regulator [Vibrio fortis]KAB0303854.1 TetR/AcrR family transcriptional regulator [Vibrio fortis]
MTTKRQQILDSALQLFAEQGVESTSTAQIAKAAGVAKATLFHHFENKSLLVDELFRELKQTLFNTIFQGVDSSSAPLYSKMNQLWLVGIDWASVHPDAMRFFSNIHFHPATEERQSIVAELFTTLDENIRAGQKSGELLTLDIELVRHFIHSHFLISVNWLLDQKQLSTDEQQNYVQQSFDMCWRAIGGKQPD